MDIIENIPYIKWISRAFITFIVLFLIFRVFSKKKYDYVGLTHYKRTTSFVDQLTQYFSSEKKPKKKKKSYNKTENNCRKILEKIYKKPFKTCRPDFLKSPMTGKNLELDCYNNDLKIALEYNGKQHYTYTPHFHRDKKAFYAQVHRDDWKRKKCREMGINLIEVPYWIIDINLESYIKGELQKKNLL